MSSTFFSELFSQSPAFYFSPGSEKADGDCLGYLRSCDAENYFFDAWPYDMRSYFAIQQVHNSIRKNVPIPLLADHYVPGAIDIWSLPNAVFKWYRSTSFEEITDQWVRFFASWSYDDKEDLALEQSPKFLHSRIKDETQRFKKNVMSHYKNVMWHYESESEDGFVCAFRDFMKNNPPWLSAKDGRFEFGTDSGQNIEGICKHWSFYSFRFYADQCDIDWCKAKGCQLLRCESDKDAFWFWKAFKGQGSWVLPVENDHKAGFVYIFSDGQCFKIGYSGSHPEKRLSQCQTGSSKPLSLVGFVRGDQALERQIHAQFASKRVQGEWFQLSQADVNEILKH